MGTSYPYMYLVCTTDMHGINVARNDNLAQKGYSDRDWFKKVKNKDLLRRIRDVLDN